MVLIQWYLVSTLYQNIRALYQSDKTLYQCSQCIRIHFRLNGPFARLLKRENIETNISFRFVDDSRFGLRPIKPGWRWVQDKLIYFEDQVSMDIIRAKVHILTEMIL